MPNYIYSCSQCGDDTEVYTTIAEYPGEKVPCKCGSDADRNYGAVFVQTFKPFKTSHITGQPVEFTTRGQRDKACEDNGVTLDGLSNPKVDISPAVNTVTEGDVREAIAKRAYESRQ